jgi:ABC-type multidrug transport system permease subunit
MNYFLRRFYGFTPDQLPTLEQYLLKFPNWIPKFPAQNVDLAFNKLQNVLELTQAILEVISLERTEVPGMFFFSTFLFLPVFFLIGFSKHRNIYNLQVLLENLFPVWKNQKRLHWLPLHRSPENGYT